MISSVLIVCSWSVVGIRNVDVDGVNEVGVPWDYFHFVCCVGVPVELSADEFDVVGEIASLFDSS